MERRLVSKIKEVAEDVRGELPRHIRLSPARKSDGLQSQGSSWASEDQCRVILLHQSFLLALSLKI
jgi:hypothetical protein